KEHQQAPHLRILQKKLAEELTRIVHSQEDLNNAINASQILFGKGTRESLAKLDEQTFLSIFEGVPQYEVNGMSFNQGIKIIDLLTDLAPVFLSKGELRRMVNGGGLSINKEKITDFEFIINSKNLLNNKYLLIQKGKKNYYILKTN
ncbi:MAG: tyrosine--tRNA ligase, partial [Bacteroidales bacterium]|nr:tyrosine--tRNA ligase [Bacteroidales bacterium]